jgi:hypothetical protein
LPPPAEAAGPASPAPADQDLGEELVPDPRAAVRPAQAVEARLLALLGRSLPVELRLKKAGATRRAE